MVREINLPKGWLARDIERATIRLTKWARIWERLQDKSEDRLDRIKELLPEAFQEALNRYPDDVEGALIFFCHAVGLTYGVPTESDIKWAYQAHRDYYDNLYS